MTFRRFIFLFLTSMLVLSNYAFQIRQPTGEEYNLKAAFLYRFLDYVEWSHNTQGNNNIAGPMKVAILGKSEMYAPLMEISRDKRTGPRTLNIRQISSVTEIGASDVVFVSRNYKFGIDAVTSRLRNSPALIISERKGDVDKGSHINFLISDNKLKFEVNLKAAASSGIKIRSQLLQHATVIKR